MNEAVSREQVDSFYQRVKREAEAGGYHLNPDVEFAKELLQGILQNEQRYGYGCCPCRLAANDREADLDIICPCYYRDPDLNEYGACYCALYVSQAALEGKHKIASIPERRPPPVERGASPRQSRFSVAARQAYPVWRCQVCGYLCARDQPPEVCPICRAAKERFERFM